jgi:hypothetical protein
MKVKRLAVLGTVVVMSVGVAACGGDEEGDAAPAASKEPVATVSDLSKGRDTAVALDPGFVKAITSLGLTPGPIGTATISKEGVATFPITGGNVTYYRPDAVRPYVQGQIDHARSGLSLSAGKTTVELRDFVVDPDNSVLSGQVRVNGEVAAESAPLFTLDDRELKPLAVNEDGTAVLEGVGVTVSPEAADVLNKVFSTTAVTADLKVGTATVTLNTK